MAQKVIVPQKKNYGPQFLKQRDINSYIRIVFSSFPGCKNIPSWGAGKRGKPPACGKKPKEHIHPLQVCNYIYSVTNIVGGGKIKRVELRTLQYYQLSSHFKNEAI